MARYADRSNGPGRRREQLTGAVVLLLLAVQACSGPRSTTAGAEAAATGSPSATPSGAVTRSPAPSPSGSSPVTAPVLPSAAPTTAPESPTPSATRAATTTATTAATTAATSTGIRPQLLGRDWERIPTSRKVVALTFDGGSGDQGVTSILRTLDRKRVPATFFLTATFVRTFPGSARSIAGAGHRIGNHSSTHPYFTRLSARALRDEVRSAERRLVATTGASPRPLFRFPYGDSNSRVVRQVNALGYVPVRWTVDSLGWQGTSGRRSASSVTNRVLGALGPGAIVLMHVGAHPKDHSTLDADALPRLIDKIRQRGYAFVTLDALLR